MCVGLGAAPRARCAGLPSSAESVGHTGAFVGLLDIYGSSVFWTGSCQSNFLDFVSTTADGEFIRSSDLFSC